MQNLYLFLSNMNMPSFTLTPCRIPLALSSYLNKYRNKIVKEKGNENI